MHIVVAAAQHGLVEVEFVSRTLLASTPASGADAMPQVDDWRALGSVQVLDVHPDGRVVGRVLLDTLQLSSWLSAIGRHPLFQYAWQRAVLTEFCSHPSSYDPDLVDGILAEAWRMRLIELEHAIVTPTAISEFAEKLVAPWIPLVAHGETLLRRAKVVGDELVGTSGCTPDGRLAKPATHGSGGHSRPQVTGGMLRGRRDFVDIHLGNSERVRMRFDRSPMTDLAFLALQHVVEVDVLQEGDSEPDERAPALVGMSVADGLADTDADVFVEWAQQYGHDWRRAWNQAPHGVVLFALMQAMGFDKAAILDAIAVAEDAKEDASTGGDAADRLARFHKRTTEAIRARFDVEPILREVEACMDLGAAVRSRKPGT